ncbi:MAG: hypothetical protein KAR33_12900 [Candidatus Thorarchaeota archaeon]|nr:hypothetical protein [Candidatus Thorarchaeota archaeon]
MPLKLENKMIGLIALVMISMGFAFPGLLIYLNVFHALDIWFVGFFTLMSLGAAFGLPALLVENVQKDDNSEDRSREIERFRESQIDLLKDLDEMIPYLREIERLLKAEE